MNIAKRKTELLAPAGSWASLEAALNAGADAIYFGVGHLNMRSGARKGFSIEDMPEIVARCQKAGAHSYLTLNVVVFDSERREMEQVIHQARRARVSAVIVSDMATLQCAYSHGLPVHISTQLSISNTESFSFYAPFCERIVLARELNLEQIAAIAKATMMRPILGSHGKEVEIEAFAHGALCIATSGRCFMSLYHDNRSANRGLCTQHCRKRYKLIDMDQGRELEVEHNNILSPQDICTIDILDLMIEAGISVFKLEGRARSPEYVHKVVSCYRRALDAIKNYEYTAELIEQLQGELGTVYNRGSSHAYYLGVGPRGSGANGSKANRKKVAIGKVVKYYPRIGVADVESHSGSLRLNDECLIIGDKTGVVECAVSELRVDDKVVSKVEARTLFSLPVPEPVREDDQVYYHQPVNPATVKGCYD